MNATLTVRLDQELKAQFTEVVEGMGLDAPTVVRMLAAQTVRDRAVPLSLALPRPREEAELAWLDAARADWGTW